MEDKEKVKARVRRYRAKKRNGLDEIIEEAHSPQARKIEDLEKRMALVEARLALQEVVTPRRGHSVAVSDRKQEISDLFKRVVAGKENRLRGVG